MQWDLRASGSMLRPLCSASGLVLRTRPLARMRAPLLVLVLLVWLVCFCLADTHPYTCPFCSV